MPVCVVDTSVLLPAFLSDYPRSHRRKLMVVFAYEGLDDYLRADEAQRLVDRLGNTLAQAGIAVARAGQGEDYWPSFVATVDAMVAAFEV